MAVKAEAFQFGEVVTAGPDEQLIEAVHEGAIAAHVQVGVEGVANELSFPAGDAEIAGSPPGGGGLSYFVRHATQEIFAISTVADDVIKSAGELVNAGLKGHKNDFIEYTEKCGDAVRIKEFYDADHIM